MKNNYHDHISYDTHLDINDSNCSALRATSTNSIPSNCRNSRKKIQSN